MPSCKALREDDFTLEFHVENGLGATGEGQEFDGSLGTKDYVLQERLIVPPHQLEWAAEYSTGRISTLRANPPLIFKGHSRLPAQSSAIIIKATNGQLQVEKGDAFVLLRTADMNLLFSEAIFSGDGSAGGFKQAFDRIGEILRDCRMDETAIARTWLYMEDILRDYAQLNQARDEFFKTWFSSSNSFIPASTGIQGRIAGDRALSIDFCAFSGRRLSTRQLSSPLQNEPIDYGKLFSRAVQVRLPKNDLVWISGTASIDKTGASVHQGDFDRQLVFTLEVLSALLAQVRGGFADVAQAIVYLKRGQDLDACLRILDHGGFPRERALFQLDVDVCRDDLLCEIELAAVIPRENAGG